MTSTDCVHYWIIDQTRGGPISKGTCRKCGETRDFRNALPEESDLGEVRLVRGRKRADDHLAARDREGADAMLPRLPVVSGAIPGDGADGRQVEPGRPLAEDPTAAEVEKGVTMGEDHPRSGDLRSRTKELEPARQRAEELFREGKDAYDVLRLLEQEFGKIPGSTVHGWKKRLRPVTHETLRKHKPATCAKTQTDPDGELWQKVMDARPDWTDKPRLGRWMDMVDSVYAFLVECK